MVNQRELAAIRSSGGSTPVGAARGPGRRADREMRDLETIDSALKIAETGHLVLATLHTRNAPQSVDRIVDVFPSAPPGPDQGATR